MMPATAATDTAPKTAPTPRLARRKPSGKRTYICTSSGKLHRTDRTSGFPAKFSVSVRFEATVASVGVTAMFVTTRSALGGIRSSTTRRTVAIASG